MTKEQAEEIVIRAKMLGLESKVMAMNSHQGDRYNWQVQIGRDRYAFLASATERLNRWEESLDSRRSR